MENKHTPGPWGYCHVETGGCICGQIWAKGADHPIATAEHEWNELGLKIPIDTMRANAQLIAGAPAMLECLKDWLFVINRTPAALSHYGEAIRKTEQLIKDVTRP